MRFVPMAVLSAAVLVGGVAHACAAPVPAAKKAPKPADGAVPPRLVSVPPAADGKVKLPPAPNAGGGITIKMAVAPPGGAAPLPVVIDGGEPAEGLDLDTVKDLVVTTADGGKVTAEEAAKRLKDGGVVAISADGKPVDPAFLAALSADTLVLAAPELAPKAVKGFGGQVRVGRAVPAVPAVPAEPAK